MAERFLSDGAVKSPWNCFAENLCIGKVGWPPLWVEEKPETIKVAKNKVVPRNSFALNRVEEFFNLFFVKTHLRIGW